MVKIKETIVLAVFKAELDAVWIPTNLVKAVVGITVVDWLLTNAALLKKFVTIVVESAGFGFAINFRYILFANT